MPWRMKCSTCSVSARRVPTNTTVTVFSPLVCQAGAQHPIDCPNLQRQPVDVIRR